MGLKPPMLQDLTAFSTNDNQEPNEIWNISTLEKNSLFWSTMIPYLITSIENCRFRQNIDLLIGENPDKKILTKELDFDVIEKRVKNINPFKNADTLYSDENLTILMRLFKKRINQIAGSRIKNDDSNYPKLEAAANLLQCRIYLYEEDSNKKNLKTFVPTSIKQKSNDLKITVFSQVLPSMITYGFGLDQNYSLNLQVNALKHILKAAGLQSTTISEIVKLVPCEHLLLDLIESPSHHVIPALFKSPYVLKKLSDAGYDINPLKTGQNGVSAFYTCMRLNDWKLFQVLYKYASSKDYFSFENIPENDILEKLTTAKDIIEKDFQSGSLSEFDAQRMYKLIIHFNKYHIEIEKGIACIQQESQFKENEKLTNTVLFIIDKYSEYFGYGDTSENKFEDFLLNYEYHKILDDFTCLLFFDQFLSLKVQLDEENESTFVDVLSSLFLYFLSKLKFHQDTISSDAMNFNTETKAKYFIIFCYRMKWHSALSALSGKLSSYLPELKDSNIIKIIEKCLNSYPFTKEEFSLVRLKMYLKIAEEADFTYNDIRASLAILRTLQIIGETYCSTNIDCPVTSLLQYCIPQNVVSVLCDVRNNCLSHLRTNCMQGRKELEQNSFLLEIQSELKDVAKAFEPIFEMQTFRVTDYMITHAKEESKRFDNDLFIKLTNMKTEVSNLEQEYYRNHEDRYIAITTAMLDLIPQRAANHEIKSLNRLKIDCESLKYLLLYLSKHSNLCDNDFVHEINNIDKLCVESSHESLSEELIKDIIDVFSGLKQYFITKFNSVERNSAELCFQNLNILFKKVREYETFPPEDQAIIRKGFSDFLDSCNEQVIDHIKAEQILSSTALDSCLKCLFSDKNKRTQMKNSMKKPDEALELLRKNACSVETILGHENETCFKLMAFLTDDLYRTIIPELCLPKRIHDKLNNLKSQKLDFLLERMKYLEEILINDNDYIKNSRKYGTSTEFKDHTKRLIMLRYIAETDTKAALEMLLLDCLEFFNKKTAFKNLWLKSTDLFLGLSIRDTLSHGCPILEVSNDLLDYDNLPLEFVNIALELIEDKIPLKALVELTQKLELPPKDTRLFIENLGDQFSDLKKTIFKCGRWERYLFLFLK